jgi:phosphotransferase system HPr (HPr) family protein
MKTFSLKFTHSVGLHARPAALLVKVANEFDSFVSIRNLNGTAEWVNAKSMLNLLTAGIKENDRLEIKTEGEDEEQALSAIINLIDHRLDEKSER